jgi:hypothetical protein
LTTSHQTFLVSFQSPRHLATFRQVAHLAVETPTSASVEDAWSRGLLSVFELITRLNAVAGRSASSRSSWPIYPNPLAPDDRDAFALDPEGCDDVGIPRSTSTHSHIIEAWPSGPVRGGAVLFRSRQTSRLEPSVFEEPVSSVLELRNLRLNRTIPVSADTCTDVSFWADYTGWPRPKETPDPDHWLTLLRSG